MEVVFSEQCREMFAQQELKVLEEILSQDPRPSYQEDPNRVYGMAYAGREVKFKVENGTVLVCGCEVGSVKAPEM